MKRRFLIGLCVFALAGCASAQMRLPDTLASQERVEFRGIGGWNRGEFTAAEYAGTYERSFEQIQFLGPESVNQGHSAFTLHGPNLPAPIAGTCQMRERSVDLGLVEITTRPMAYRCEFRSQGRPVLAWLELQEVNGPDTAINRYERRGRITLGNQTVELRSAHHLAGTTVPTSTPIGYTFEQDGHPVGAVELNGRPVLVVAPGASEPLRDTLALAALALGVFWDPANLDT